MFPLQIGHFMLDNAANNNVAMRKLSECLASCGIHFPADECRIMCLPHILNTCSKHVTEKYCQTDFFTVADEDWIGDSGEPINKAAYIEVLSRDPINRARQVAKSVHASNLHQEAFKNTIDNTMGLWVNNDGEHVDIPQHELLWDVKSRWNSIYTMVFYLQELQLVCNIFHNQIVLSYKLKLVGNRLFLQFTCSVGHHQPQTCSNRMVHFARYGTDPGGMDSTLVTSLTNNY